MLNDGASFMQIYTLIASMQNHGGCKSLGLSVRIMIVHEGTLGELTAA